ncbi:MAG TPA: sigma-54 dependent transcriptional regulator [Candidatus Aminicenantes bacterium]|nr:sigma-54 dependent transcriptional regulator [Candidatus Aminicenantes bacterium]
MDRILLVEDNAALREMLASIIAEKGYAVDAAADVASAMALLKREDPAVIVSDLQLPDMDGLTFLKRTRDLRLPFIILTAYGSIEKAVEAIKEGAWDFIAKPVDPDYLLLMIAKALAATRVERENLVLREVLRSEAGRTAIIGSSRELLQEAEKARQVAQTQATVLLRGESGTGKELVARAIHALSPRRDRPFLTINSASIPENLLENELFGHEKGSYTGAHMRQAGKLELAQGGTFFFDEIGDLPLPLQGKILRLLEEKTVTRLGGGRPIPLDIRFIFATNQDLEKASAERRFRQDLYYRITSFPIDLPPLRERRGDIPLLADHFVRRLSLEVRKREFTLSAAALEKLAGYSWPGNVRELQNAVERAVITAAGPEIDAAEIVLPDRPFPLPDAMNLNGSLKDVSARAQKLAEKLKISQVLAETGFNRTRAAEILEVSYKTLLDKIKEYGLAEKD